jgi:hypothetical protein
MSGKCNADRNTECVAVDVNLSTQSHHASLYSTLAASSDKFTLVPITVAVVESTIHDGDTAKEEQDVISIE